MSKFKKGGKPSGAFAAIQRAGAEEAVARKRTKLHIPHVPQVNYRELIARNRESRPVDDDPLFPVARVQGTPDRAEQEPNTGG